MKTYFANDSIEHKWYVVDAENETRAVEIANKVVHNIWGDVLATA